MGKWSAIKVLCFNELCWCMPWFVIYFYSTERKRRKLGSASSLASIYLKSGFNLVGHAPSCPLSIGTMHLFLLYISRQHSVWLGLTLLKNNRNSRKHGFWLESLDSKLQETQCNTWEWMTLSNHTHIWWNLTNMFPVRKATLESWWLILWEYHLDAHRPKGKRVKNDEGISREWVIRYSVWASCPLQIIALIALKNGNCSAWHEML